MLVNRSAQPAINDVVTLKLVSGEEIVGRLSDRQVDSVTLAKPVVISMQQVGPNQIGLAFMQLLGSVPDPQAVQFPLAALAVRPVRTGDDVAKNYTQATSSIIAPAAAQTQLLMP